MPPREEGRPRVTRHSPPQASNIQPWRRPALPKADPRGDVGCIAVKLDCRIDHDRAGLDTYARVERRLASIGILAVQLRKRSWRFGYLLKTRQQGRTKRVKSSISRV
jgi:hypothetical protein